VTQGPTVHEERALALAQRQALLEALRAGQVVNRKWAHDELDIFELSARIVELEQSGIVLKKGWTQVPTRYGNRKVRTYELASGDGPAGLPMGTPEGATQTTAGAGIEPARQPSPPPDSLFPTLPSPNTHDGRRLT
jgi:hypothetical protein